MVKVPAHEGQQLHGCLLQEKKVPVAGHGPLRVAETQLRDHVEDPVLHIFGADGLEVLVLNDLPAAGIGDELFQLAQDIVHAAAGFPEQLLHGGAPDLLACLHEIAGGPGRELLLVLLPELAGEAMGAHQLVKLVPLVHLVFYEHEVAGARHLRKICEKPLRRCLFEEPGAADQHETVLREEGHGLQRIDQGIHLRHTLEELVVHPVLAADGLPEHLLIGSFQIFLTAVQKIHRPVIPALQVVVQLEIAGLFFFFAAYCHAQAFILAFT